jgi:hypothetical protein
MNPPLHLGRQAVVVSSNWRGADGRLTDWGGCPHDN